MLSHRYLPCVLRYLFLFASRAASLFSDLEFMVRLDLVRFRDNPMSFIPFAHVCTNLQRLVNDPSRHSPSPLDTTIPHFPLLVSSLRLQSLERRPCNIGRLVRDKLQFLLDLSDRFSS
jgi:hypothetical protein